MKVLFITNLFPVDNAVYNGEYVRQQAVSVSKFCSVDVTYPKPIFPQLYTWLEKRKQKTFFVPGAPIGLENSKIRFFYFRYPYFTKFGLKDMLRLFGLALYVFAKRCKPDLIHAHFTYECGYLGTMLGKFINVPVIITVHESFVFLADGKKKDIDGKWNWDEPDTVIRKKYIQALKNADGIIAVSGQVKQAILKLGVDGSKVRVIGNGVNPEQFKIEPRGMFRASLSLPPEKKIILYVGSIFPGKGVFDLLDAVRELADKREDFIAVLVGSAGSFLDRLREHIARNNLENLVMFVGPKHYSELPKYFTSADVCALPSYQETFSCTTIESLASGTPVVGTKVGVLADILRDENGFLVPVANHHAIAEKLDVALDKKWDRKIIRASAEPFYWKNIGKALREFYIDTTF